MCMHLSGTPARCVVHTSDRVKPKTAGQLSKRHSQFPHAKHDNHNPDRKANEEFEMDDHTVDYMVASIFETANL